MNGGRPRVAAEASIDGIAIGTYGSSLLRTTPDVQVSVEFDLGEHDAALALLEAAVVDVRAQIERVGRGME